jgi:hypothetical protein
MTTSASPFRAPAARRLCAEFSPESVVVRGDAAASSRLLDVEERRKRPCPQVTGCNCNRTRCLKRFCPCFKAGVPCTSACNCADCANRAAGADLPRSALVAPELLTDLLTGGDAQTERDIAHLETEDLLALLTDE